jgi:hypothetical protein
VQMEARVTPDPRLNAGMFVSPVIVDDQMQIHFRRSFKVDRLNMMLKNDKFQ